MSEFDTMIATAREHPELVIGLGGAVLAGTVVYAMGKKKSAAAANANQSAAPNPVNGTTDIGGQPGVLGFVGWAPVPNQQPPTPPPTTTPPTSGGTVYNWKPTGALKTAQSPGRMVWYALYKGDSTDPNAYYINVFNRSGTLMDTINRGCVNKDTPQGEMCVGFNKPWGPGKGGPYAAQMPTRDYDSVQPFGGAGGFLPVSSLSVSQYHVVQPGETAESLARHYIGDAGQADRFLAQNPSWDAGQTVRVW